MEVYRLTHEGTTQKLLLDLFEEAEIDPRVDREILANRAIAECGAMYPIWNTTNTFCCLTAAILRSNKGKYKRILDAIEKQYNPIDNVDYTEHIDHTTGNVRVNQGNDTRTPNLTDTTTGKVSADNESGFSNRNQNTTTETGNETTQHSNTDSFNETGNNIKTKTGRTESAQDLLRSELELAQYDGANIYDVIITDIVDCAFLDIY